MIQVVWQKRGDALRALHMTGHTDVRSHRSKLNCAAISAIVQTSVLGLTDVLGIQPDYCFDETGESRCILPNGLSDEQEAGAQVILRTLQKGLESIEMGHPGTLKILVQEED